jgi:hypothetical protein
MSSFERRLRRSVGKAMGRRVVANADERRPSRLNIPADLLTKASETGRTVLNKMASSDEEFRSLVSTGKYDRCIADAKWNISSGRKIINIVCPGYNSEPAASIVKYIINSSVHDTDVNINKGTSEAIVDEVTVGSGVNIPDHEKKNVAAVSKSIFGTPMFNHLSPHNMVVSEFKKDAERVLSAASEGGSGAPITEELILSAMPSLRSNDIVYNPDNPMSYTYLCRSVKGIEIVDVETKANEKRKSWKLSGGLSQAAVADVRREMSVINGTIDKSFLPYRVSPDTTVASKISQDLIKVAARPKKNVSDPNYLDIARNVKLPMSADGEENDLEVTHAISEYVGSSSRMDKSKSLFERASELTSVTVDASWSLGIGETSPINLVVSSYDISHPESIRSIGVPGVSKLPVEHKQLSGGAIPDGTCYYTGAVRGNDYINFVVSSGSKLYDRLNERTRNHGKVTFEIADGADIYSEEYEDHREDILKVQKKYGIKINRGPLPNWAPDLYDYRDKIPYHVGGGNNLYQVNRALVKRLKAKKYLEERKKLDRKNSGLYSCALEHLLREIGEISKFMEKMSETNEWATPVDNGGEYDASGSLLRYNLKDPQWMNDEISDECIKRGLNVPRFGGVINESSLLEIIPKNQKKDFLSIVSSIRKKYGLESTSSPSAVVIKGIDGAGASMVGNGLVSAVENSSTKKKEMAISQKFQEMLNSYSSKVRDNKLDRSHIFIVTESAMPNDISETVSIGIVYVDAFLLSDKEVGEYINIFSRRAISNYVKTETNEEKRNIAKSFFLPETFAWKFKDELAGMSSFRAKEFVNVQIKRLFDSFISANGDVDKMITSNEMSIKDALFEVTSDMSTLSKLNVKAKAPVIKPVEYLTKEQSTWSNYVISEFGSLVDDYQAAKTKIDVLCRLCDCGIVPVAASTLNKEVKTVFESTGRSAVLLKMSNGVLSSPKLSADFLSKFKDIFDGRITVREYNPQNDGTYSNSDHDRMIAVVRRQIDAERQNVSSIKRNVKTAYFLYGAAGSGKSIFADVLANSFDLRFNMCTMNEVFSAGRDTMFRGQSENNLQEFFAYCRNCRNTVILIDELNKVFEGESRMDGSMQRDINLALMQTLEEDKGLYAVNGTYFVFTSNKGPEWFSKESGASPFLSRINAIGGSYEVEVPTDFESLKKMFKTDTIVNNTVTAMTDNNVVAETIKLMIAARRSDDEKMLIDLAKKIESIAPDVMKSGFIFPKSNRDSFMSTAGFSIEPEKGKDPYLYKVNDFLDGFIEAQKIFQSMDVNMPGKNYSYLDMICHRMMEKMNWEPDSKGRVHPRTGIRDLNGFVTNMLRSHRDFLSGVSGALPLNAQNLWHAVNLSEWNTVPPEFANDPVLADQAAKVPKPRDGWMALRAISSSKDLSLPYDVFLSKEDKKYIVDCVSSGVDSMGSKAVGMISSPNGHKAGETSINVSGFKRIISSGEKLRIANSLYVVSSATGNPSALITLSTPLVSNVANGESVLVVLPGAVNENKYIMSIIDHTLSLTDGEYNSKVNEIIGVLNGKNLSGVSSCRLVSKFLSEFSRYRSELINEKNSAVSNMKGVKSPDQVALVFEKFNLCFTNIVRFVSQNKNVIKSHVPNVSDSYLRGAVKISNPRWLTTMCRRLLSVVSCGRISSLVLACSESSDISTDIDRFEEENEKKKMEVFQSKGLALGLSDFNIHTGEPTPEMISWLNSKKLKDEDIVLTKFNTVEEAKAYKNSLISGITSFIDVEDNIDKKDQVAVEKDVQDNLVDKSLPVEDETTVPVEDVSSDDVDVSVPEIPTGDFDFDEKPETYPSSSNADESSKGSKLVDTDIEKDLQEEIDREVAKLTKVKSSYIPLFSNRIRFAQQAKMTPAAPSSVPMPVAPAVSEPVKSAPVDLNQSVVKSDPKDVATDVSNTTKSAPKLQTDLWNEKFMASAYYLLNKLQEERNEVKTEVNGPYAALLHL